jgi:hypothetical protein
MCVRDRHDITFPRHRDEGSHSSLDNPAAECAARRRPFTRPPNMACRVNAERPGVPAAHPYPGSGTRKPTLSGAAHTRRNDVINIRVDLSGLIGRSPLTKLGTDQLRITTSWSGLFRPPIIGNKDRYSADCWPSGKNTSRTSAFTFGVSR